MNELNQEYYILYTTEIIESEIYLLLATEKEVNGVLPVGSNVEEAYVSTDYSDEDEELIYLPKEQVDALTFATEDGCKYILNNSNNRKKLGLKYKEGLLQRTTGAGVKEDYVLLLDQAQKDHLTLPFLSKEGDSATADLRAASIDEAPRNKGCLYLEKERAESLITLFPDGSRVLLNDVATLEQLGLDYDENGSLQEAERREEPKAEPKEEKPLSWLSLGLKTVALCLEIKKALEKPKTKPAPNDNGLNALADEIHQVNRNKGFWDKKRNVGEMLMLVTSELGEGMEALRKEKFADMIRYHQDLRDGKPPKEAFEVYIKDSFEDEIADAVIRLLDMATGLHINLEQHIRLKLDYNRSRERFHGKAF